MCKYLWQDLMTHLEENNKAVNPAPSISITSKK